MTAEITKPEKEDSSYPFQKMNIWFEDFDLKKPERTSSGVNSGFDALNFNPDDQSSENDNN